MRDAAAAEPTGLVPADLTADDLLAWTSDVELPVRATLELAGPAVPVLRSATGSQALGAVVAAGNRDAAGAFLVLGVDPSPEVLLNAAVWAARPSAPEAAADRRSDLVTHPAWTRLKQDVSELQAAAGQGRLDPGRGPARPRPRARARHRRRAARPRARSCRTTRTT